MTIGFIKLHRKLVEWEWYSDVNVCRVFLHLLITANFEDKKWRGIDIKRGQQISSYDNLAKATNLSKQQLRTALNKLKSTNELTITSTSLYTIFSLTNYCVYQDRKNDSNMPTTHGATNEQQTSNIPSTTTKERKEIKEGEEGKKTLKKKPKGFIPPSLQDVQDYCKERNNSVNPEKWISHYQSNGWKVGKNSMKDWKAAIRTWEGNSFNSPKPQSKHNNFEQQDYYANTEGFEVC